MTPPDQPASGPWRTLGAWLLIPPVAVVGGLAVGGALLVGALAAVGRRWRRIEPWALGLCMGGLAALVAAQTLAQHAGRSLAWTEEIGCLLAMTAVWCALPGLLADGQLLSVEVGPLARRPWARWIAGAATLLFFALLLVLALDAMPPTWSLRTDTLHIPRRLLWLALPVAIALAAASCVARATEWRHTFRPVSVKHTK